MIENRNLKKLFIKLFTSERSFESEYFRTVHNWPRFDNALDRYISSSVCFDAFNNVLINREEYFVDISPCK